MEERAASAQPPKEDPEDAHEDLLVLARLLDESAAEAEPAAPEEAEPARGDGDVYLVADRFEVVERIGGGAHGTVLSARDHDNQKRLVALKILSVPAGEPGGTGALEARARELLERLTPLRHDTINRLRDVGRTEDGRVWLASDLVDGETVRDLADRAGAIPPRQALEIVRQVLTGLARAHALGLPHGRLVPENVALASRVPWTENNPFAVGVRLCDHGVAAIVPGEGPPPTVEADLLATALLLAELLAGTRFAPDGSDWLGSEATVTTAALSAGARRVLDTALAAEPELRFPDAASFRAAIERTGEWRPGRGVGRWPVVVGLVLFALAVVVTRFLGSEDVSAAEPDASRSPAEPAELAELGPATTAAGPDVQEEVSELQARIDASRVEAEDLRAEGATLRTRALAAESERDRLRAESERRAAELAAELAAAEERLREAEEARRVAEAAAVARPEPEPEVPVLDVAAERDRLLALVAGGDTAGARATLDALPATPERDEVERQLVAELERRWAEHAAGLDAAPDVVAALAAWFDDGRLTERVARYARAAEEHAAPRGVLALAPLRSLEHLTGWERIAPTEEARTALAELAFARAFHVPAVPGAEDPPLAPPPSLATLPPDAGWRGSLALRARLLDDERGIPGPVGARFLFHARTAEGETTWRWEEVRSDPSPPADGDASRLVHQTFHDTEGVLLGERTVRLVRVGRTLFEEDLRRQRLLDLGDPSATLEVRAWTGGPAPAPPAALGVDSAELEAFRRELDGGRAGGCLVVERRGARWWWSPALGLVRHADPVRITSELVFASLPE
jgi:hypothetical protein